MSLSQAYLLLAAIWAVAALAPLLAPEAVRGFPRSRGAAFVLFGAASAWFLWNLAHVGEADLAGIPREWLLAGFGFSAVAAFRLLPDLLAVRGLAGLLLLVAGPLLDAGFGKTPQSLLLASLTYVLIIGSLAAGTAPYLLRDLITFVRAKPARVKTASALSGLASVACVANALLI